MGYYANKFRTMFWTMFYLLLGRFFFAKLGKGCRFEGWVDIPQKGGEIIIGKSVRVCRGVELSVPKGGTLDIGDRCSIGRGVLVSAHRKITIGADSMIAEYVCIHDNDHVFADAKKRIADQGFDYGDIIIDSDCWIGAQAVVLKGARVGHGSVIGAKALVNKKYGPNSVLVGIPAKPITIRS